MTESPKIAALRAAVSAAPEAHALRLVLAEALVDTGEAASALDEYSVLLEAGALDDSQLVAAGELAVEHDRLRLAARCLELARQRGVVGGTAGLAERLTGALSGTSVLRRAQDGPQDDDLAAAPIASALDPGERRTFADVGGLDDVKTAVHRTIILPFQRPDLYERYGRRAGGGVLLFGPPGCGKTLIARATAGECGLPFLNVRVEEVLDPYFGVSEARLHDAFEQARAQAPCVLFLDELDAIGFARRKQAGTAGRALVDQLLQELDSIGSDNSGILVLAATNAPWDVDDALKRPGRFDRVVFVPPPDAPARGAILELALHDRPIAPDVEVKPLVDTTALCSGADLHALVERGVDLAIDEALREGHDVPVTADHLRRALKEAGPTTGEWLRVARNYIEFANEGGRYDAVEAYLATPEVKRLRKRGGTDRS